MLEGSLQRHHPSMRLAPAAAAAGPHVAPGVMGLPAGPPMAPWTPGPQALYGAPQDISSVAGLPPEVLALMLGLPPSRGVGDS